MHVGQFQKTILQLCSLSENFLVSWICSNTLYKCGSLWYLIKHTNCLPCQISQHENRDISTRSLIFVSCSRLYLITVTNINKKDRNNIERIAKLTFFRSSVTNISFYAAVSFAIHICSCLN